MSSPDDRARAESARVRPAIGENPLDLLSTGAITGYDVLDSLLAGPPEGAHSPPRKRSRSIPGPLPATRPAQPVTGLPERDSLPLALEPLERRLARIESFLSHPTLAALASGCLDGDLAGLVFRDAAGQPRLSLGLRKDGTPCISLFDATGAVRASLDVAVSGSPALNLFDAHGRQRLAVDVLPDGTPGLVLFDPAGAPCPTD